MPIDSQAVRRARENLGLSQDALAAKAGVSQTTIDKIERGETKNSRYIIQIAAALNVEPSYLNGDVKMRPTENIFYDTMRTIAQSGRLPVYAAAEGGAGNLIINTQPLEMIERPEMLMGVMDAYAIYVVGESMMPEFEPGDRAIVNPQMPIIRDVTCVFFSDAGQNDVATIKRLIKAEEDTWKVQQWNPGREFELAREEWPKAHRVIGKWCRR